MFFQTNVVVFWFSLRVCGDMSSLQEDKSGQTCFIWHILYILLEPHDRFVSQTAT